MSEKSVGKLLLEKYRVDRASLLESIHYCLMLFDLD